MNKKDKLMNRRDIYEYKGYLPKNCIKRKFTKGENFTNKERIYE